MLHTLVIQFQRNKRPCWCLVQLGKTQEVRHVPYWQSRELANLPKWLQRRANRFHSQENLIFPVHLARHKPPFGYSNEWFFDFYPAHNIAVECRCF